MHTDTQNAEAAKAAPFGYQMSQHRLEAFGSIFGDIAAIVDDTRHLHRATCAPISDEHFADTATPVAFLLSLQTGFQTGKIAFQDEQAVDEFIETCELFKSMIVGISDPLRSVVNELRAGKHDVTRETVAA